MNKWDELYMDTAIRLAQESKCPRTQVGCVILLESGLTAFGINGFPEGQEEQWTDGVVSNPLVTHSEANAIGKLLEEGVSCKNATLYITMQPCLDCSKILVRAKIKRVVYKDEYRIKDGLEYLQKYGVQVERWNSVPGGYVGHNEQAGCYCC